KAYTSPDHTPIPDIQTPRCIRVSLDYEGEQVAFFSVDEGVHIFTFARASFNGKKVHPWFWV
ncbi:BT1A1 protein, partial [Pitta sordida]|nr:BT1A1 protein [Pitta sordida]